MNFELNHIHELEDERDDEKIPFTQLPSNHSDTRRSTKINNTKVIQRYINHNYHWHARDVTTASDVFENSFTDPRDTKHTPMNYFFSFLTEKAIHLMIDNINLCSVQKTEKSVNVTVEEIKLFIADGNGYC